MAKRKAARASGRKATRRGAGRAKAGAKKGAAARKGAARRPTSARAGARKSARKVTTPRRDSGQPSRRSSARARKAGATKAQRRPSAAKRAAPKAPARPAPPARASAPKTVVARKAPNLNRERRIVRDDDTMASVPSSLDLDRRASAARTGRRELRERFAEHTETSPQLTGGDVDADWESAYSVGDEAPGGDNPTPDQDIVDDIGRAVGVEYQDNEELKGADKVAKRDKHRWELDPASSEDYDDRD
jgi:Family of unknown function (DUF6335)